MACCSECQNQDEALRMIPLQLQNAGSSELQFFVQGVRTGLAIRAADQAKWQRFGVILAVAFGAIAFMKHIGE